MLYWESPQRAGWYSLMDSHFKATHFDPFHKLKSGFVTPDALEITGLPPSQALSLGAVETRREITILYDPARGDRKYFILENRWAGNGNFDSGLPSPGVAVWHIVEDFTVMDQFRPPFTGMGDPPEAHEWGRLGIRLMGVLTGAGQSRLLRYADGSTTGVTVTTTTGSQEVMGVRLDRA